MNLLLLTPNLENNSLGRTHCLWLLARRLGWTAPVAAVKGRSVWAPLADSEFAADCRVFTDPTGFDPTAPLPPGLLDLARQADVIVAVKPLLPSFGTALRLGAATGTAVLLDIDDPDLEARTAGPLHLRLARLALRPSHRALRRLAARIPAVPRIVSNEVLRQRYGGEIIPHVREPRPMSDRGPAGHGGVVVRFVGSARPHKGIDDLRVAVGRLADRGYRLEITAPAPADAAPHETWLGTTTMAEGARLVATADIVAIPSRVDVWSAGQLPAKLIDAMMAGVAVVGSDLGPIRWALGDAGVLVPPNDVDALTTALADLADPQRRARLGAAARQRAEAEFSVAGVAPAFEAAVRAAAERSRP